MSNVLPFPVLLGDIGGTNARFAAVDAPDAPLRSVARLRTADYRQAVDGVAAALALAGPIRPRSLLICGAGPREGATLQLTNATWLLDGPRFSRELDLEQGMILNDFEAQALSLPVLPEAAFRSIGPRKERRGGAHIAVGPGTGLGLATLVTVDGRFMPLPSEAGHLDVGPVDAQEDLIWPHLERVMGRVTSESLLSGSGLLRLHKARLASRGASDLLTTPEAVGDAALAGAADAVATVRHFWRILARFTGDMALVVMAHDGVSIMGGIGPRLLPLLDEAEFRAAFEAKAPMTGLMVDIPTDLVTETDAALHGLAGLARSPGRYLLDFSTRLWRPSMA